MSAGGAASTSSSIEQHPIALIAAHYTPLHSKAPHSPLGGMSSVEAKSKLHHLGSSNEWNTSSWTLNLWMIQSR